jgi:hypothetical protein
MKKAKLFVLTIYFFLFYGVCVFAGEPGSTEQKYVGEFFDVRVPLENYLFVKSVMTVFGNRWGAQPKTSEQEEGYIWEQLLLSYEAFRRGVAVAQEETEQEITKLLEGENAGFDWKVDNQAFEKWVKEKTSEPQELFRNQVRHLLEIDKLRQQVMDAVNPLVQEKEARQEFLNENNSIGIELVQFDKQGDAFAFYKQVRTGRKFWEAEKATNPKRFKRVGTVTLQFLIDLWGFPEHELYKMLRLKNGAIYQPIPIYKGYTVACVLDKNPADLARFKKSRDYYYEKVRRRKKYDALIGWLTDLKKEAKIKVYGEALVSANKKEGGEK